MLDFLLGKPKRFIDGKNLNLISDKYFSIYLFMPFNLNTLYNYLRYLRLNNINTVRGTPYPFYKESVAYWVTDRDGYVYDYINMLDSILDDIDYYKEHGCVKLNRFLERISLELDKLELEFIYKRVKNK